MNLNEAHIKAISIAFPDLLPKQETHKTALNSLQKQAEKICEEHIDSLLKQVRDTLQPFLDEQSRLQEEYSTATTLLEASAIKLQNSKERESTLLEKTSTQRKTSVHNAASTRKQKRKRKGKKNQSDNKKDALTQWAEQHKKNQQSHLEKKQTVERRRTEAQSFKPENVLSDETVQAVQQSIQNISDQISILRKATLLVSTLKDLDRSFCNAPGVDHELQLAIKDFEGREIEKIKRKIMEINKRAEETRRKTDEMNKETEQIIRETEKINQEIGRNKRSEVETDERKGNTKGVQGRFEKVGDGKTIIINDTVTNERLSIRVHPPYEFVSCPKMKTEVARDLQSHYQDTFSINSMRTLNERDPMEWISIVSKGEIIAENIIILCEGNTKFIASVFNNITKQYANQRITSSTLQMAYGSIMQRLMAEMDKWQNSSKEFAMPKKVNAAKPMIVSEQNAKLNFNIESAKKYTEPTIESVLKAATSILEDSESYKQYKASIKNGLQYEKDLPEEFENNILEKLLRPIEKAKNDALAIEERVRSHARKEGFATTTLDESRILVGIAKILTEHAKKSTSLFDEAFQMEAASQIAKSVIANLFDKPKN